MANYERGVYEPSEEVRVFDGAEEDEDVEGSRLPLLIVLALLVLAMFAGVVWLAYTQGVARGRGETPVLTAAAGPERIAPQQPGGTNVPYQGFKIYEQPAPQDDGDNSAPPAPAPAPAPVAPVATAPAKVAAAPVSAPVPVPAAAPKLAPPPPKPAAMVAASKPVPSKPAPAKAASPKSVADLITAAPASPPAPPPPMKQAVSPTDAAATDAPRSLSPPAKAGGGYVLQIGSYKSQADAEAAWKTYKSKHAALLAGYGSDVRQADLGEKGTWYRLRVAGLPDKEVATGLCDRLKADGGACILGK